MRQPIYERLRRKLYEHEIRTEGRNEMMNTMFELMRAHGISPEQIDAVKAEALKAAAPHS